jgi:hypothetical protein
MGGIPMKISSNTSSSIEPNYQKMDAPPLAQKFASLESKKPAAKAQISEEGKELAKKQGSTKNTSDIASTEHDPQAAEAATKKQRSKAALQEQKDVLTNFYAKKLANAIKKLETENVMPAELETEASA